MTDQEYLNAVEGQIDGVLREVHTMRRESDEVRKRLGQAIAVLRDLEWSAIDVRNHGNWLVPQCPACKGTKDTGHKSCCGLADALLKAKEQR